MGSGTLRKVWRYARWFLLALLVIYLALLALGTWHLGITKKTADAVASIQSRHISTADVDGKHLPPAPDKAQNEATVAGIDANHNGIRDDVELAIFAKYPNDQKLRAAELQYAFAQQIFLTSVFNTETWKAAAIQLDRGYQCIGETYPRTNLSSYISVTNSRSSEVEALVYNTLSRKEAREKSASFTTSYGGDSKNFCDIK